MSATRSRGQCIQPPSASRRGFAALAAVIFATLTTAAELDAGQPAAHWPRFRGPDANPVGAHPDLPLRWSTSENVEWVADIPGVGWSSPVVWGSRVFLTAATSPDRMKPPSLGTDFSTEYIAGLRELGFPPDEVLRRATLRDRELPHEVVIALRLTCLDVASGATLWERELYRGRPRGGRHRKNSYASETPVTDGENVYVYLAHYGFFAFDFDGNPVWDTPLAAHATDRDFGTGASPALHGERLYVLNDNEDASFLAAFDKRTGAELWRTPRDAPGPGRTGWSTPFVWENAVRSEIVTVGPGAVTSYDLDGAPLWRMGRVAGAPVQSPFAWSGRLFVTAGATDGRYRPLAAIRAGAAGDITPAEGETASEFVLWYDRLAGGTFLPTPVIYDGGLYVLYSRGILARYDPDSGERRYRTRIAPGAAAFTSSPCAYRGHVFALSEEGETFVIEAGDDFRLAGVNDLGDWALASPAIAGDRLLIRTRSRLYAIREQNPATPR